MMDIWMVMLIFGKVAMVAGPLPFDMERCERERTVRSLALKQLFREKSDVVRSDRGPVKPSDVDVKCLRSETQPLVEYDIEVVQ